MPFLVLAEMKKGGAPKNWVNPAPMLIDPIGLSSWVKFWSGFFGLIKLEPHQNPNFGLFGLAQPNLNFGLFGQAQQTELKLPGCSH